MFNKILLLLVLLTFLIYGETITKSYSFGAPQIVNGKVYLQGCNFRYTHFAPSVVEKPVVLLLPKGEEAVSIDVDYSGETLLEGTFDLKPILPGVRLDAPPPGRDFYETRSAVYKQDQFYPGVTRSSWLNTQYKNGHGILYSTVHPVQYNPVTGIIKYYKNIKVTVNTQVKRNSEFYLCTPSIMSEIESMVDNPEAVADVTYTQQEADDYEYLIITTDALKGSWGDFVSFNERRGLRTKIETVANINSTGTGSDSQQKIRNYIKKEYTDNKITYVLLGADDNPSDAADCNSRLFGCKFWDHDQTNPANSHEESDIGADMYFECLDGDWKKTGDPYYGAPGSQDMTWEVFSGRFPVRNASQLANMIKKTIDYSEKPVADVKRLYLAGNWLWINNGVNCTGGNNTDEHIGTCTKNGYTTIGFPSSEWSIQKLYEESADQWTVTQLRSGLKSQKPTFFIHDGHGNPSYVWCEQTPGVTTGNYPQDGATNGSNMIAITGACLPGAFNDASDCIMESFARLSTGLVASISNDKSGWGDNDGTDGCTHRPFRYCIDALFNPAKQMHHLGRMHTHGKEAQATIVLNSDLNTAPYFYCITYCIYETILMGDPALSVWTQNPQTLTASITNPVTTNYFEWNGGLPYTSVALCDDAGKIFATQLTGKDGKCKIDNAIVKQYLETNNGKQLTVRVKAHNYKPYEGKVDIKIGTGISNGAQYKLSINRNANLASNASIVKYSLNKIGQVNMSIFNSKGLLVKTLVNGQMSAGDYSVPFNAGSYGNGIFYCRLTVNGAQSVQKFYVIK